MDKRQMILDFMATKAYRPLTLEELATYFEIEDVQGIKEFSELLIDMEQKGQVILTRKKRYGLPQQMNLVVGRVQRHAKGFAFNTRRSNY